MTTREFMHNYWRREIVKRRAQGASPWKIKRAELQLNNYK